jgi:hypothetical protein
MRTGAAPQSRPRGVPNLARKRPRELSGDFKTFLLWRAMPNDELNLNATLNRTANALEHIACSLLAIEMLQAAQAGGAYEESLHAHRSFQHDGCAACGTKAQNAPELARKLLATGPEGLGCEIGSLSKLAKNRQRTGPTRNARSRVWP